MAGILEAVVDAGLNLSAVVGAGGKTLGAITGAGTGNLENLITLLSQPSLCFVPIMSESLVLRRSVDVGTTMLITQTTQEKDYVTDNAAPRPRVWTGKGYIQSLVPLVESGIVLKPTLIAQQAILEAAADARQPVKFKTDTGEVANVLIVDLQIGSIPKGNGVKSISYTVQEVKVLENSLGSEITALDRLSSTKIGKAVVNSIPGQAALNLGRGTLIGTGTAVTAGALMLAVGGISAIPK